VGFPQGICISQFKNRIILISKSEIKLITSLRLKKYRNQYGYFVAEGEKLIMDLLTSGMKPLSIFATEVPSELNYPILQIDSISLQKISNLKATNGWLAVFYQPKSLPIDDSGLIVVLDSVRDPGNLGTIIRLCDWFGVRQLICSEDTVDLYNPKVVQATMGSLARVQVHYTSLEEFLDATSLPIVATVLDGDAIYDAKLPKEAVIVMGSEAHGVSSAILSKVGQKLTIPNFSQDQAAESLNVATATAILLSEFRRVTGK